MPNEQKFISLNVLEPDRQNRSRKAQDGTLTALMWSVSGIIIAACGGGGGGGGGPTVVIDGGDGGTPHLPGGPTTPTTDPDTPGGTQRSDPILNLQNARNPLNPEEILTGFLRAVPVGEPGSGQVFVSSSNVLSYTPLTDLIAYAYEADPGKTVQDILNQIFGFQVDGTTSFITQNDILNFANYDFTVIRDGTDNQIAEAITKAGQAIMALRNPTGTELGSNTDGDGTTTNNDHRDLGTDASLEEIQALRLEKLTNLFAKFRDRFDDNTPEGDDLDEDDNDVTLTQGTLKDAVAEIQEKAEEHAGSGRPFAISNEITALESIGEQLDGMEIIYDFNEQISDYASIARLFNFVDPDGNPPHADPENVNTETLTGVYIKAVSNSHTDGNDIRLFYRVNDNLITQLNTDLLAEGESTPSENFRVLDANPYFYISMARLNDLVIVANGDLHSGLDEASLRKFVFDYYVWDGQAITLDISEDSTDIPSQLRVTIDPVNDAPHSLALDGARTGGEYVISHQGDIIATNGEVVGSLSVTDLETTDIGDFTFSLDGEHGELFEVITEIGSQPRLRMKADAEQINPGDSYSITIIATDNGEGTSEAKSTSIRVELVQGGIYITNAQGERATNDGGDLVDEEVNPNPHLPTEPSDERLTTAPPQELTASGSVTIVGMGSVDTATLTTGETVYLNIGSRTLEEAIPAVEEDEASVEFAGIVFTAATAGVAGNDIDIVLTLDTSLTAAVPATTEPVAARVPAQVMVAEASNVVTITYGEGAILSDIIAGLASATTVNVELAEGMDGTEGVLEATGEIQATPASATLGGITFTAGTAGVGGNDISVSIAHDSNLDAVERVDAEVLIFENDDNNYITIAYGTGATLGDIVAELAAQTTLTEVSTTATYDGTNNANTLATEVSTAVVFTLGVDAGADPIANPAVQATATAGGLVFTAGTGEIGNAGNGLRIVILPEGHADLAVLFQLENIDTDLTDAVAGTAARVEVDATNPNAIAITYGEGADLDDILAGITAASLTNVSAALADGANNDDAAQEASDTPLAGGVDAFVPDSADLEGGVDAAAAVPAVIAEVNGVDLGILNIEGGLDEVDPDGIYGTREFYLLDDPANADFRILQIGNDQHLVYIGTGVTDIDMADIPYTIKIGVGIRVDHLPDMFSGMVEVDASGDSGDDNANTFHYSGGAISVASGDMVSVEAGTLYLNDGRRPDFAALVAQSVTEEQLVVIQNNEGVWAVTLVDLDAPLAGTPGNDYVVLGRVELDQPAQQASRLLGDQRELLVSAELPAADAEDGNDIAVAFTAGSSLNVATVTSGGVTTHTITYAAETDIGDLAELITNLAFAPVSGSAATTDTLLSDITGLPSTATQLESGRIATYEAVLNEGEERVENNEPITYTLETPGNINAGDFTIKPTNINDNDPTITIAVGENVLDRSTETDRPFQAIKYLFQVGENEISGGTRAQGGDVVLRAVISDADNLDTRDNTETLRVRLADADSNNDNHLFSIDSEGNLRFNSGEANHERSDGKTVGEYQVVLQVESTSSLDSTPSADITTERVMILVTNQPEAPSRIYVERSVSDGAVSHVLTTVDPILQIGGDQSGFSYALVGRDQNDYGSRDNNKFEIVNGREIALREGQSDTEFAGYAYQIRVHVTDADGLTHEEVIEFTLSGTLYITTSEDVDAYSGYTDSQGQGLLDELPTGPGASTTGSREIGTLNGGSLGEGFTTAYALANADEATAQGVAATANQNELFTLASGVLSLNDGEARGDFETAGRRTVLVKVTNTEIATDETTTHYELYTIRLNDVNDAPILGEGAPIPIAEDDNEDLGDNTVILTEAMLAVSDADASDNKGGVPLGSFTFTLETASTKGNIEAWNIADETWDEVAVDGTFTLQQVREGHVRFVRDATEQHVISADNYAQADDDLTQFTLTISDGNANNDESASRTYTLQVTGVNDQLQFVVNAGVGAMEGTSTANTTAITSAMLRFSDIDNSADELIYTITAAPTKGWIEKEVSVAIAASRTIGGLVFTAEATGSSGNLLGVRLTASGQEDSNVAITVTSNNIVFSYGTEANLNHIIEELAAHAEDRISATLAEGAAGGDDITATSSVLRLTGGRSGVEWEIVRVGETFTQGDINSGDLRYRHDGSDDTNDYISDSPDFTDTHEDSFAFTVTDSLREGSLGKVESGGDERVFEITITPTNDAPTQVRSNVNLPANNGGDTTTPYARDYAKSGGVSEYPLGDNRVVMNEGEVYVLTLADIGVYDPDHADGAVTYQIFNLDGMRLDLTDTDSDLTDQTAFASTGFQAFVELDTNTDSDMDPNWVALREMGGSAQEFTLEDVREGKVRIRHTGVEQFRDGSPEFLSFSYRFKDATTADYSGTGFTDSRTGTWTSDTGATVRIDVTYTNDAPTHLDLGFYKVSPDAQPGDNLNAEAGTNGAPSYFSLNDEEIKDDGLLTGYRLTTGYRDNHFFEITRDGQFTQLAINRNIDPADLKLDGEAYYIQIEAPSSASLGFGRETFEFILPVRRFDIDWDGSTADLVSGAPERVFDLDPNYDDNPHTVERETSSDRNGDVLTIGTFTIEMEGETPVLNAGDSYAVITSASGTPGTTAGRQTVAANDLLDAISLTNPTAGAGNDDIWLVTATPNKDNPILAALGNDESLTVTFTLVIEHAATHQDIDRLNPDHDLVGRPPAAGAGRTREAGSPTADSDGVRRSFETFTIRFIGHEEEDSASSTTSASKILTVYEDRSEDSNDSGIWDAPASDGDPGGFQQKASTPAASTLHALQVRLGSEADSEYRATNLIVNQEDENYNPDANPYQLQDEYGILAIWADGRIEYTRHHDFVSRVPAEGATQEFVLQAVYREDADETMMTNVTMNIRVDIVGENTAPEIWLNGQSEQNLDTLSEEVSESTDSRSGGSDARHVGGGVNDSDIDIGAAQRASGTFSVRDYDLGAQLRLFSGVYEIGAIVADTDLTFEGRYGTLTISDITENTDDNRLGGSWTYEADSKAEKIAAGARPQDVFELRVVDEHGTTSGTIDLAVTVVGSNDSPLQFSRDFGEGSYDGMIIESGYRSNDEHNFVVSGDPNENGGNIHPPRLTDDVSLPDVEARRVENVRDGETDNDVDGFSRIQGTLDVEDIDVIGSDGRLISLENRDQHSFVIERSQGVLVTAVADPHEGIHSAVAQLQAFLQSGDNAGDATYTELKGEYGTLRVYKYTGEWDYILDNFDSDTAAIDEDDNPTDDFRVVITDQHGAQSVDLISITVNGSEDAPILGINDASPIQNHLDLRIGEKGGRLNGTDGDAVPGASTRTSTGRTDGDTASGQFTYYDDDGDDTGFVSGTSGGGRLQGRSDADGGDTWTTANGTTYHGEYGDLVVQVDGSWEYTLRHNDRNTQALNDGDRATDSFDFRILDNTRVDGQDIVSNILTLEIYIFGANDAPELREVRFTDSETEGGRVTEEGSLQDGTVIIPADPLASGTMIVHDVDKEDIVTDDDNPIEARRLKVLVAQTEEELTPGLPQERDGEAHPDTGRRDPQTLEIGSGKVIQGTTSPDSIAIPGSTDAYETRDSYGVFTLILTPDSLDSNNNRVDGLLTWRYDLRGDAADALGAGQAVTESVFVRIYDGSNATDRTALNTVSDIEEIRVTIEGSNDGPTVTGKETSDDVNGLVFENTILTDSGILAFGDVDSNDPNQNLIVEISSQEDFSSDVGRLYSYNVVGNERVFTGGEVTSDTVGTVFAAGDLGIFRFSRNDDDGELIWTYQLNDDEENGTAVDKLGYRETVTDSVWVRISDGRGGVGTQQVAVTIEGVNDAPILEAHTESGDITLREDGTNQAGATITLGDPVAEGTMAITDHDGDDVLGDSDLVNGLQVLVTSDRLEARLDLTAPIVDGEQVKQIFKESEDDGMGGMRAKTFSYGANYGEFVFHIDENDNLVWRFVIDEEAANSIGASQYEEDTVWIRVYDQHGGASVRQELTVTIYGSNDSPTIDVPGHQSQEEVGSNADARIVATGLVIEDEEPSYSGQLRFGDEDDDNANIDLTILAGNNFDTNTRGFVGDTVTVVTGETIEGSGGTAPAHPDEDYAEQTYASGELGEFSFTRLDATGILRWTYTLHEGNDLVEGLADGEEVTDTIWIQVIDTSGLPGGKDLSDLATEPALRSQVVRSQFQEVEVTIRGSNSLPEVSARIVDNDDEETSELSDANEERYFPRGTISYSDADRDHDSADLIIEVARNEAFEAEIAEVMAGETEWVDFDGSGGTSRYRLERNQDSSTVVDPITFGGGELGYFSFRRQTDQNGEETGKLEWEYTLNRTDLVEGLSDRETIEEHVWVRISDEHGAGKLQKLTAVITGSNDAPFVEVGIGDDNKIVGGVAATGGSTGTGTFSFGDLDNQHANEKLTIYVSNEPQWDATNPDEQRELTIDGIPEFLGETRAPNNQEDYGTLIGSFSLTRNNVTGKIEWTYTVDDGVTPMQLPEDQYVFSRIWFQVVDPSGAKSEIRELEISVAGGNDVPNLSATGLEGSVTEGAGGVGTEHIKGTASGTLTYQDPDQIFDQNILLTITIGRNEDFSGTTKTLGTGDSSFGGSGGVSNRNNTGQDGNPRNDYAAKTYVSGELGIFTFVRNDSEVPGELTWTYTLRDTAVVSALAGGEEVTDSIWIKVSDRSGGESDEQQVTVTISGTNDRPFVTEEAGDVASAQLTEDGGTRFLLGSVSFGDDDRNDPNERLIIKVASHDSFRGATEIEQTSEAEEIAGSGGNVFTVSGRETERYFGGENFATFFVSRDNVSGKINWRYSIKDVDLVNSLAEGQTVTDSIWVQVTDGNDVTSTAQRISVTIVGRADGAVVGVRDGDDSIGYVIEDTRTSDTGFISFSNVDGGDNAAVAIAVSRAARFNVGTPTTLEHGVPTNFNGTAVDNANVRTTDGTYGTFTFTRDNGAGRVKWEYNLNTNAAVNALKQGEIIHDSAWVRVGDDTNGAQLIEVSIEGTNDEPTAPDSYSDSEINQSGGLVRIGGFNDLDGDTLTYSGTIRNNAHDASRPPSKIGFGTFNWINVSAASLNEAFVVVTGATQDEVGVYTLVITADDGRGQPPGPDSSVEFQLEILGNQNDGQAKYVVDYPEGVEVPVVGTTVMGRRTETDQDTDIHGVGVHNPTYQWFRDHSRAIDGATSISYTITSVDIDRVLHLQVIYFDGSGNREVVTSNNFIPGNVAPILRASTDVIDLTQQGASVVFTVTDPDTAPSNFIFSITGDGRGRFDVFNVGTRDAPRWVLGLQEGSTYESSDPNEFLTLSITASDGQSDSDPVTVTVRPTPPNTAPSIPTGPSGPGPDGGTTITPITIAGGGDGGPIVIDSRSAYLPILYPGLEGTPRNLQANTKHIGQAYQLTYDGALSPQGLPTPLVRWHVPSELVTAQPNFSNYNFSVYDGDYIEGITDPTDTSDYYRVIHGVDSNGRVIQNQFWLELIPGVRVEAYESRFVSIVMWDRPALISNGIEFIPNSNAWNGAATINYVLDPSAPIPENLHIDYYATYQVRIGHEYDELTNTYTVTSNEEITRNEFIQYWNDPQVWGIDEDGGRGSHYFKAAIAPWSDRLNDPNHNHDFLRSRDSTRLIDSEVALISDDDLAPGESRSFTINTWDNPASGSRPQTALDPIHGILFQGAYPNDFGDIEGIRYIYDHARGADHLTSTIREVVRGEESFRSVVVTSGVQMTVQELINFWNTETKIRHTLSITASRADGSPALEDPSDDLLLPTSGFDRNVIGFFAEFAALRPDGPHRRLYVAEDEVNLIPRHEYAPTIKDLGAVDVETIFLDNENHAIIPTVGAYKGYDYYTNFEFNSGGSTGGGTGAKWNRSIGHITVRDNNFDPDMFGHITDEAIRPQVEAFRNNFTFTILEGTDYADHFAARAALEADNRVIDDRFEVVLHDDGNLSDQTVALRYEIWLKEDSIVNGTDGAGVAFTIYVQDAYGLSYINKVGLGAASGIQDSSARISNDNAGFTVRPDYPTNDLTVRLVNVFLNPNNNDIGSILPSFYIPNQNYDIHRQGESTPYGTPRGGVYNYNTNRQSVDTDDNFDNDTFNSREARDRVLAVVQLTGSSAYDEHGELHRDFTFRVYEQDALTSTSIRGEVDKGQLGSSNFEVRYYQGQYELLIKKGSYISVNRHLDLTIEATRIDDDLPGGGVQATYYYNPNIVDAHLVQTPRGFIHQFVDRHDGDKVKYTNTLGDRDAGGVFTDAAGNPRGGFDPDDQDPSDDAPDVQALLEAVNRYVVDYTRSDDVIFTIKSVLTLNTAVAPFTTVGGHSLYRDDNLQVLIVSELLDHNTSAVNILAGEAARISRVNKPATNEIVPIRPVRAQLSDYKFAIPGQDYEDNTESTYDNEIVFAPLETHARRIAILTIDGSTNGVDANTLSDGINPRQSDSQVVADSFKVYNLEGARGNNHFNFENDNTIFPNLDVRWYDPDGDGVGDWELWALPGATIQSTDFGGDADYNKYKVAITFMLGGELHYDFINFTMISRNQYYGGDKNAGEHWNLRGVMEGGGAINFQGLGELHNRHPVRSYNNNDDKPAVYQQIIDEYLGFNDQGEFIAADSNLRPLSGDKDRDGNAYMKVTPYYMTSFTNLHNVYDDRPGLPITHVVTDGNNREYLNHLINDHGRDLGFSYEEHFKVARIDFVGTPDGFSSRQAYLEGFLGDGSMHGTSPLNGIVLTDGYHETTRNGASGDPFYDGVLDSTIETYFDKEARDRALNVMSVEAVRDPVTNAITHFDILLNPNLYFTPLDRSHQTTFHANVLAQLIQQNPSRDPNAPLTAKEARDWIINRANTQEAEYRAALARGENPALPEYRDDIARTGESGEVYFNRDGVYSPEHLIDRNVFDLAILAVNTGDLVNANSPEVRFLYNDRFYNEKFSTAGLGAAVTPGEVPNQALTGTDSTYSHVTRGDGQVFTNHRLYKNPDYAILEDDDPLNDINVLYNIDLDIA